MYTIYRRHFIKHRKNYRVLRRVLWLALWTFVLLFLGKTLIYESLDFTFEVIDGTLVP